MQEQDLLIDTYPGYEPLPTAAMVIGQVGLKRAIEIFSQIPAYEALHLLVSQIDGIR